MILGASEVAITVSFFWKKTIHLSLTLFLNRSDQQFLCFKNYIACTQRKHEYFKELVKAKEKSDKETTILIGLL